MACDGSWCGAAMKRIDRLSRLGLFLLAGAVWSAALPDAASGQDCVPPQQTAKGHLELRHGELRLSHELDTAGIRNIVNQAQGYVAGSWHVPLGLTFAEIDTRFETSFRYRKAQPYGYCVALSEAKVSIGSISPKRLTAQSGAAAGSVNR